MCNGSRCTGTIRKGRGAEAQTAYLLRLSRRCWVFNIEPDHQTYTANAKACSPIEDPGAKTRGAVMHLKAYFSQQKHMGDQQNLQEAHQEACHQPYVVVLHHKTDLSGEQWLVAGAHLSFCHTAYQVCYQILFHAFLHML